MTPKENMIQLKDCRFHKQQFKQVLRRKIHYTCFKIDIDAITNIFFKVPSDSKQLETKMLVVLEEKWNVALQYFHATFLSNAKKNYGRNCEMTF